jgi:hypothetical protein
LSGVRRIEDCRNLKIHTPLLSGVRIEDSRNFKIHTPLLSDSWENEGTLHPQKNTHTPLSDCWENRGTVEAQKKKYTRHCERLLGKIGSKLQKTHFIVERLLGE